MSKLQIPDEAVEEMIHLVHDTHAYVDEVEVRDDLVTVATPIVAAELREIASLIRRATVVDWNDPVSLARAEERNALTDWLGERANRLEAQAANR